MKNSSLLIIGHLTIAAILAFCSLSALPRDNNMLVSSVQAATQQWYVGQHIEVYWKGNWYPASIIAANNGRYRIHYDGYGNEWDEWTIPTRMRLPAGAANSSASSNPYGKFQEGWVEHNVFQNGHKGMRLHFRFSVGNELGSNCRAVGYFYYRDGGKLKAKDKNYSATDGQVSIGENFVPKYNPAEFNNFQLFMPYDELNMANGSYQLKFNVRLYDNARQTFFATSDYYNFDFNK